MSNPFRRSSLKNLNVPSSDIDTSATNDDVADVNGSRTSPIPVYTRVPSSTSKHVNFASPPVDVAIPAVSYPSSPESTRFSPPFQSASPAPLATPNYGAVFYSNPFSTAEFKDDREGVIDEALQNAYVNTTIPTAGSAAVVPDLTESPVRNTLNKFVSVPRRPSTTSDTAAAEVEPTTTKPQRQTMDVDAFKRLLLTGDSGQVTSKVDATPSAGPDLPTARESSAGADVSSSAQQSLLDLRSHSRDESSAAMPDPISAEMDPDRQRIVTNVSEGKRRPPPTPKPKYGKSLQTKDHTPSIEQSSRDLQGLDQIPLPPIRRHSSVSSQSEATKQPPTPPLSRRQSQRGSSQRLESPRLSAAADPETTSVASVSSLKSLPPLPPPSRRRGSENEAKSFVDLPTTLEEPVTPETSPPGSRQPSGLRPALSSSRASSISKRSLSGTSNPPPPLPPPRRQRDSLRNGTELQNAGCSIPSDVPDYAQYAGSGTNNSEVSHTESDSRKTSASSAHDFMADLAALQKEVDAARRSAFS